jgi:hypothetical protein
MTMPRLSRGVLLVTLALAALTAGLLLAERAGVPVRFAWRMGGDVRRESRLLEQYGQVACALIVALLIWHLDPPRRRLLPVFAAALLLTAGVALTGKTLIGRDRPEAAAAAAARAQSPDAVPGEPIERPSERESFPSAHTAGAVAMTVILSAMYPRGRSVFWLLAVSCGMLRYVNNAHWPSDVVGGAAVGYVTAHLVWAAMAPRYGGPVDSGYSGSGPDNAARPAG